MRIVDPQNIWKKMKEKYRSSYRLFSVHVFIAWLLGRNEDVFPQENRISQVNARRKYDFAGGNKSSHLKNVHAINYYNE